VNDTSTRKQFFSKLLGVVAATNVLPRIFAKSAASKSLPSPAAALKSPAGAFEIRHDTRAVARRDVL
jgi:hypothetical protein